MPERDDLYTKYRVFREPDNVSTHPVPMIAQYYEKDQRGTTVAQEVEEFVFVLKPDTDPAARIALLTYAASVAMTKPQLANDLHNIILQEGWL